MCAYACSLVRTGARLDISAVVSTLSPNSWTTLAAVAVTTSKMRVGTMPRCIYYRIRAVLARAAADIDQISHGRLVLELGICDAPYELAALNLPYPSVRERQQALEETIQIIQALWGEQPFTYQWTTPPHK